MSRYASGEGDPIKASDEFKEMVKALHSAGIEVAMPCLTPFSLEPLVLFFSFLPIIVVELIVTDYSSEVFLHFFSHQVILDVVYNHTNEADDKYPYTTSFRGIDNKASHKKSGPHFSLLLFLS